MFNLFLLGEGESGICAKFLQWKKRSSVLSQPTSSLVSSLQIFMYVLNKKIFVLLISQAVQGEVYFVLVSVLFCHIRNRAFTSTIQHRFGNSIDQSEHA